MRVCGERVQEVREGRALDHRQLFEHHAPLGELPQDLARTRLCRNLVEAGLDAHVRARQAQVPLHRPRIADRAGRLQVAQDRAQAGTGGHLDARARRGRTGREVGVLEPGIGAGRRGTEQQQRRVA